VPILKGGEVRDMMIKNGNKGFSLIEIMIVVAIIGLLAAIAIPNYMKSRETARRNSCVANMKQLREAIHIWAIDTGAASNATFTTSDIVPNFLKDWPKEGTVDYPVPSNASEIPVCPSSAANTDHVL
jgi:prepilin-type N-terminal cleavage/methylation domain-containing protein